MKDMKKFNCVFQNEVLQHSCQLLAGLCRVDLRRPHRHLHAGAQREEDPPRGAVVSGHAELGVLPLMSTIRTGTC